MKPERFEKIINLALNLEASDIHLKAGTPPAVRIMKDIVFLKEEPLTPEEVENLAFSIMPPAVRDIFLKNKEVDFPYEKKGLVRFRVNVYTQRQTIAISMRLIKLNIPSIEELGLPTILKNLATKKAGLILVTGPSGSGKSTTLAAMIEYLNQNESLNIITIEDPIEYVFTDKLSLISQREIGIDTSSFYAALKMALREDPNIIMVGELRDLESVSVALQAAETGHLVLSTLHTIDAVSTISRIVDMFPPYQQNQVRYQLASTLVGVISQRLLKRKDKTGLVPACEVLIGTSTVRKWIRENKLSEIPKIIEEGRLEGMQSFNQHLLELYRANIIDANEALMASPNPSDLELAIKGIVSG
ncbi:twitching motility protein [Dictyoglomus turgidum DSM 6724]|uniref:Twitching motility protein n=1 Tax=Dictyoglomus turgidum (strain DSM 6724 / Z-1310) TaxID=515635 RepID=B8E0Y5_DICTD|nr:twitching motility protein [Dictyoglomus turgidum DSM 6724]HBU30781.1 type IV pilus twitching motility protein PilT [Dictyoglomus sp.]